MLLILYFKRYIIQNLESLEPFLILRKLWFMRNDIPLYDYHATLIISYVIFCKNSFKIFSSNILCPFYSFPIFKLARNDLVFSNKIEINITCFLCDFKILRAILMRYSRDVGYYSILYAYISCYYNTKQSIYRELVVTT